MAAVAAVLGVGGVLELGQGERIVLHAEVHDALALAAEVRHERVVGVEHQCGAFAARGDEVGPAVGEQLQLAVAVELVAEEVAENQEGGIEFRGDAVEPSLVDLEQPQLALAAACVDQRGGHAPVHVRAGAVAHDRAPVELEHAREHRGGGGLPIRGRDQRDAPAEALPQVRDGALVDAQQQPSRDGGAAAPRAPDGCAHEPRERNRGPLHQAAGTITRSTRSATRIFTGSSATGSPSA
jgi:hypothetical protein